MIDDLVRTAAETTGMDQVQVRRALSSALGLIAKHAAPGPRDQLFAAVPGAQALATEGAREIGSGGGGLMGGLMRAAGGASGSALADGKAMLDKARAEGVSQADLQRLLGVATDWVQSNTGQDLLGQVLASIPGLGGMLGRR